MLSFLGVALVFGVDAVLVGATVACHALELEPLGVFPTNAHIYAVFGIDEIIDLGVWADSCAGTSSVSSGSTRTGRPRGKPSPDSHGALEVGGTGRS